MTAEPSARTAYDPGSVEVHRAAYGEPDVVDLVAELMGEYVARYGDEDGTPLEPDDFVPPTGEFIVVRVAGQPLACGAFRRHDGTTAEIKRMYVRPAGRGRGLARLVLAELESRAAAAGYTRVVLETGNAQPEAMALYASSGYHEIAPYGFYRCSPESHCYAKALFTRDTPS